MAISRIIMQIVIIVIIFFITIIITTDTITITRRHQSLKTSCANPAFPHSPRPPPFLQQAGDSDGGAQAGAGGEAAPEGEAGGAEGDDGSSEA